uniref:Peptidyl-prolyl cis-trans isomerase n=1 Tax=Chromera velia CCMP2878 TaxID=1169474 RepID=A0A0G4I4E9_9ALVE|eukprot:Cvel_10908.t1-p1 / transcript=Cvel_10908.t1 / gene=Cvel_10908 / organism=Chromera_velia_CCMP2878 / gene_product=Peptidyl-prolyl cis-trans isomerase 1, putative / transcript_product=Peptidyl-prolyl cis-trans isomerase 1, putative / location=Cvel_scaffold669:53639-54287(+) / protein_length=190 / sequence_SO=supercontig / SO=protein_coding / is_pseudo=false
MNALFFVALSPLALCVTAQTNPRVFFDLEVGGSPMGRIVMELRADVVPKTAENFRALSTCENGSGRSGKQLCYKGTSFHRVVSDVALHGGDFVRENGTGGESIYGADFEHENYTLKHDSPYVLTMENSGPGSVNSRFMITLQDASQLDGVQVVFGEVVEGTSVLTAISERAGTSSGRPSSPVVIANSGQL